MSTGLVEGSLFAGRYRVVRCIAAGGMGAVYEVVHLETERRRALKVMLPHVLQSAELRDRFQREAKVAAHVESDYIVDVFDAGYDDATRMPFLVMELLRGEELGKKLKRLGRLPATDVVTWLHQTALALDKTHKASIVHRDLKPENLFLTERDDGPARVKVLDFGIAKVVAESATTGGATQSIGTPLYMAPEQFNPMARLTGAADRYALAMVAYTLLAGGPYWAEEARGGNVLALAMVAVYGPREAASARAARRGATLPPAFDGWFARATAIDPAQRFGTSVEMIAAMAQALGVASTARAAALSVSAVDVPYMDAAELATVPLAMPMGALTPGSAPITVQTMATTGAQAAPRSRGPVIAAAGAAAVLIGGALALWSMSGRSAPAAPSAPAASQEAPARAEVSAAPIVSPSAIAPSDPPLPSATASAAPKATAAPQAAPTAQPTATPKPPSDAQRKKMWGRD